MNKGIIYVAPKGTPPPNANHEGLPVTITEDGVTKWEFICVAQEVERGD